MGWTRERQVDDGVTDRYDSIPRNVRYPRNPPRKNPGLTCLVFPIASLRMENRGAASHMNSHWRCKVSRVTETWDVMLKDSCRLMSRGVVAGSSGVVRPGTSSCDDIPSPGPWVFVRLSEWNSKEVGVGGLLWSDAPSGER